MTWVLLATLLFASVLPCPTPAAPAAPAAATHVHDTEGDAPHAASLRAPCHCGCENAPRTEASFSRLPLALLLAAPEPSAPALWALPDDRRAEAPEPPAPRLDHVPRHALA